jgi:hypothetical protein
LALPSGHWWLRTLEDGKAKSVREIAEKEKVDNSYVSRIVNLASGPYTVEHYGNLSTVARFPRGVV